MFGWLSRKREQEIKDELDYHLAMLAGEPAEGTLHRLGNRTWIQEEMRRTSPWAIFENARRNAVYALRMMRRNPAFSVTAILTMALGIGSAVLIFSILDAVILRPLPYRDSNRIVFLWEHKRQLNNERTTVAPANYQSWKESNRAFSEMALVEGARFHVKRGDETPTVRGLAVSSGFFQLLGAAPRIGRIFSSNREVVLSDSFWRKQFHSSRDVIGKPLALDGQIYLVAGVMPPDFYFPDFGEAWEVWTPLQLSPGEANDRDAHCCGAIGRLRPQVTIAQARRQMNQIAARLEHEFPETNRGAGVTLVPVGEQANAGSKRAVEIMIGAVCVLLLIACANVSILLLVRAAARRKEIALRLALGASSLDLFLQFVTESLILGLFGGGLGIAAASALLPLFRAIPANLPRLSQISMDWRVLLFSVATTLATGVLFGLAPAFQMTRGDLRGGSSRIALRSFVVAEVALAFLLVGGAGLLIRSLERVLSVNAGFRPEHVLTATVSFPQTVGRKPGASLAIENDLLVKVNQLPGVISAGWTSNLPIGGTGWSMYFSIQGRPMLPGEIFGSAQRLVSPGYFETMGIPVLAGRGFNEQDRPTNTLSAVVNDVFARRYFAEESPIGHRVKWGRADEQQYPDWFTIVGVVGGVHDLSLETPPTPELYMCLSQMTGSLAAFRPNELSLVVRHAASADSLIRAIRVSAAEADPRILLSNISTMDDVLSHSLTPRKFNLVLFGSFAGLALGLSWIGIYGLIGYSTSLRTHEIGIRIALGSSRGRVVRLVLREACALSVAGIGVGFVFAWALGRVLESLLFQVNPHSPAILFGSAATLVAAAVLAGYFPARRVVGLDPSKALRSE